MEAEKPSETGEANPAREHASLLFWAGPAALLLLFAILLAFTWRRWADPVVDFGREAYVAWRIAEGDILYRDVFYYYGPLAAHINGLLFKLLGTQLTWLFVLNAALTLGCLFLIWKEFVRQAGQLVGFAAGGIFLFLFAFGHFSAYANYNFLAPYSHELTWGFFLLLLMLTFARADLRAPSLGSSIGIGFLGGLAMLTKIEIALAAAMILGGWAGLRCWGTRLHGRALIHGPILDLPAAALAVLAPGAAAATYFVLRTHDLAAWHLPFLQWQVAWEGTLGSSATNLKFLGLDNPSQRLLDNLKDLFVAIAVLALIGIASIGEGKTKSSWVSWLCWMSPLAASLILAFNIENWELGMLLPAAAVAGLALSLWKLIKMRREPSAWQREAATFLWCVLALGLLPKMGFYPRIQHYGFVLALPSTLLLLRLACKDYISWLGSIGGCIGLARFAVLWLAASLVFYLSEHFSLRNYQGKVVPVGPIGDHLYYYAQYIHVSPQQMEAVRKVIMSKPGARSLVVLPEGAILNYWTRLPSSISFIEFTPPLLKYRGQARLLSELQANPPDLVVIWSRHLGEYHTGPFGTCEGSGSLIKSWVETHYDLVLETGASPFAEGGQGARIYALKSG